MTKFLCARLALITCASLSLAQAATGLADDKYWVEPMARVHERFTGKPGTLALFGDSITVSMAFWAPLAGEPKGLSPDGAAALKRVKSYMRDECWRDWRGPEFGNNGSMTIRWAHENVEEWLKRLNPEVALIMFGTNDLGQLERAEYETKTRDVVRRCLENGTIVILNTIPPASGRLEKSREFAQTVAKVAREEKVPLVDYFGEVLRRRPDDWDGTLKKFADVPGDEYQVPTLVSRDGVHPSYPREFAGDFSDPALNASGYGLRSYLALMQYSRVIEQVLQPEAKQEAPKPQDKSPRGAARANHTRPRHFPHRIPAAADNWPHWRGPMQTGASPAADPPLNWNEADGRNIRWKTEIPGRGHSTPIVWDDRIFLTAAVRVGEPMPPRPSTAPGNHDNLPVTHRHRFVALAVSRSTGKILWQKTLHEAVPHEQGHYTGSLASNSPVTDGEYLYVFFGSFGLYCLDLDGQLVWKADFGPMQSLHGHGEGSSPALYNETLVVNWDHEGQSFIVALNKRTGKERWRVERNEVTSWSSPIIIEHAGKPQVIVSGTSRVRGYDLTNGKVLWECGGLSSNIVASPVSADGMVFAGSSYDKRALLAIHLDGAVGDITGTDRVAWRRIRGTPYVPSPLLYEGGLYFLTHYQGLLSRVDAHTGQDQPGAFRLDGIKNVYSSPVAAAGRIYVTDLDGTTLVIKSGAAPQRLALNNLSEPISASAAMAGRQLFLRGEKHLYCLEEE